MSTYNQNNETFDPYSSGANGYTDVESEGKLLTKVFLMMFISLLATAAVAYIVGRVLANALVVGNENVAMGLMIAMIGSGIGLLVLSFVIPIKVSRGLSSIWPAYIAYLVFMGILLSTVYVAYDMSVISLSFGITAGVFGIMAFLGYVSKGSFVGIGPLILGLIFGSIGLSLVNIFLQSEPLAWVISFAVFAVILFITMYDVKRIKHIINSGYMNNNDNLMLYCSFILLTDFINIFIRILRYVAYLSRKR
ncbi:MAG: US12 family protein [Bacilli bacterium]|nr:US12 family protein [Bacilli bacterium]